MDYTIKTQCFIKKPVKVSDASNLTFHFADIEDEYNENSLKSRAVCPICTLQRSYSYSLNAQQAVLLYRTDTSYPRP